MTDTTLPPDQADTSQAAPDALYEMVLPGQARDPQVALPPDDPARPPSPEDYGLPSRPAPPIPNGWYAIARSHEMVSGQITSVIAVGRELIAYRGTEGTPVVMDAHCPHLGAHLGGGRVEGASIVCPYHGWEFGSDGVCVDIPYGDARIPAKACNRTYPVREQDGFVLFWFHAGGQDPNFEIPRTEEAVDPDWSDSYPWEGKLEAALAEMGENNVDYAHLRFVHGRAEVPLESSTFTTDGPFATVIEELDEGMTFTRHAWGPGVALLRIPGVMTILATTTPLGPRHVHLRWSFYFPTATEAMSTELISGVVSGYGLPADVPIWRDKVYLDRPVLVKADGHIAEFRRWYSQFY